ncbi:MAG: hypothetical protein ACXAC8_11725 [Candidatus Hodarchaeales archaeon]|jgi:hypothetical protein
MTTHVLNTALFRNELSKEIEEFRLRSQNKKTSWEEMADLTENLLQEREIMIQEFEDLRLSFEKYLPDFFRTEKDLNLILNEIDEMDFNDFLNVSNKLQVPPGEILSSLMQDVVANYNINGHFPNFSANNLEKLVLKRKFKISIDHQESLTIEQHDLVEMGVKINFNHIETLEFGPDIDMETFITFVGMIQNCNLVRVPKTIPKIILWSKCNNCSYFQFYGEKIAKPEIQYAKEANQVVEDWKVNGSKNN